MNGLEFVENCVELGISLHFDRGKSYEYFVEGSKKCIPELEIHTELIKREPKEVIIAHFHNADHPHQSEKFYNQEDCIKFLKDYQMVES